MFRGGVVRSLSRRSKDVISGTYEPSRSRPTISSSTEESLRFLTPAFARHCFHSLRSHLKAHLVPCMRNFCSMVSSGAEHKEGLKLLINGGPHAQKLVGIWLFGSAAWVFSMVVLGGVTRLTRSGLSMTDWKFTGSLPSLSDEEWLQEFEKYMQSPEYKRQV